MEATYKILGTDGNHYGPASADQLLAWIKEGRAGPETQVCRTDESTWAAAATFPEFGFTPAAASPAPVSATSDARDPAIAGRIKSGASWFYWIAALSAVNSVIAMSGGHFRFIFGLGITQVIDAIPHELGSGAKIIALVLDLLAAGLFVIFGVFANKRHGWSFIIGMTLFGLDGLLTVLFKDWMSVAFHAFALYCIFQGYRASRQARG